MGQTDALLRRIQVSPWESAPSSGGGDVPTYDFAKFSKN